MLNYDELNILVEAIDKWSKPDIASDLLYGMLASNPENKEESAKKTADTMKKTIDAAKDNERQAVLIKAKLYQLIDQLEDTKGELTVDQVINNN